MTNTTNTTNIAITKGVIATTTKEASAHTLYANSFVQNSKFSNKFYKKASCYWWNFLLS